MLANRLIDGLYTEAMLLADEVRAYFDDVGRDARDLLDPMDRVLFSCESLKVTTRLMHVIAWLLTQRAVEVGELTADGARDSSRRLGGVVDSDIETLNRLPPTPAALSMPVSRCTRASLGWKQGLRTICRPPVPHESCLVGCSSRFDEDRLMGAGFTALDMMVIVSLAVAGGFGAMRGFVLEVFLLTAWVAGIVAVKLLHESITASLTSPVGSRGGASVLAVVVISV